MISREFLKNFTFGKDRIGTDEFCTIYFGSPNFINHGVSDIYIRKTIIVQLGS